MMLFGKRKGWKWKEWICNESIQIEKRNYKVWIKNTLHVSSVNITSWSLLERESWWTVSQNIQTPYDELLLKLCFDTMVH